MTFDATFWVAISFLIFIGALVYLKVPQKINSLLSKIINDIKNELEEAEKLKEQAKDMLNQTQIKFENANKEKEKLIQETKKESEKIIIEMNNKFHQIAENRKKITEQKISQMKEGAIKSIKDAAVQIAIESSTKIIQTSVDKSKLDNLFKENLLQVKNSLKKTTRA